MPTIARHPPILRMSAALVVANARYWSTVAPLVRTQLAHWTMCAEAIPNPSLQDVALQNLREEGFNAQATATLATLAPSGYRKPTVEAIVGLQVIYDYLDSLVEMPHADPIGNGHRLYKAFIDAVAPDEPQHECYYDPTHDPDDGGYLAGLVAAVRAALRRLPGRAATREIAKHAAERCSEAQVRAHATSVTGEEQLQLWATDRARPVGLQWRDYLAGAVSSGLSLHALTTLASSPRATNKQAIAIDTTYMYVCALTTLLDGLVDYEQDLATIGHAGYIRYYHSNDELSQAIRSLIQRATAATENIPDGSHHLMTLVGVVAYYISAPTAAGEFAQHLAEEIHQDLKPLITPPLAVMRAWRIAKRKRSSAEMTPTLPSRRTRHLGLDDEIVGGKDAVRFDL